MDGANSYSITLNDISVPVELARNQKPEQNVTADLFGEGSKRNLQGAGRNINFESKDDTCMPVSMDAADADGVALVCWNLKN